MLTVLSVAPSLDPLGPDAAIGPGQVAAALDAALVEAGHESIVIAAEGSVVRGSLLGVPGAVPQPGTRASDGAALVRAAIATALAAGGINVVHLHGDDYEQCLPPTDVPVLVTLHGARAPSVASAPALSRHDVHVHAASAHAHRALAARQPLLAPIESGVPVNPRKRQRRASLGYALMLTRVVPESGVHLALAAARAACIPLFIAGDTAPARPAHARYLETEILPHLDLTRRLLGPAGRERRERLLAGARCLVVCADPDGSGPLAAREALAAGAPVVAFGRDATGDSIEDGLTGLVVTGADEVAGAMLAASRIDPEACRAAVRNRFDVRAMTARYLQRYAELAAGRRPSRPAQAASPVTVPSRSA